MSFADFGVRSFVPDSQVGEFASHLRQGKVMASRCRDCGHVAFPPRSGCTNCGSAAFEWIAIDEVGRLVTYTRVEYGPAGFEAELPYVLAIARFPLGVTVFGQLSRELAQTQPHVGMPVKLAARLLANNRASYHFVQP
ncbi:MAG: Zn-ribbon domain-containing OB-fold protein [Burkholderiales bacterium]|nr:Zn-ribbon domain-containing OB-fold protein [Burkholderiales bacterium]